MIIDNFSPVMQGIFMKQILLVIIIINLFSCTDNNPSGIVKKPAEPQQEVKRGINPEGIFKNNCARCHKCDEETTGPALNGAFKRWTTKERLVEFVQNAKVSYADTEHVKNLKIKYEINYEHKFNNLSEDEIKAIIYWCHNYGE